MFNGLMLTQHATLSAGAAMSQFISHPLRAVAAGIPAALHMRDIAERGAVQWLRSVRLALLEALAGGAPPADSASKHTMQSGRLDEDEGEGADEDEDEDENADQVHAWARLRAEEGLVVPATPDFRGYFSPWR